MTGKFTRARMTEDFCRLWLFAFDLAAEQHIGPIEGLLRMLLDAEPCPSMQANIATRQRNRIGLTKMALLQALPHGLLLSFTLTMSRPVVVGLQFAIAFLSRLTEWVCGAQCQLGLHSAVVSYIDLVNGDAALVMQLADNGVISSGSIFLAVTQHWITRDLGKYPIMICQNQTMTIQRMSKMKMDTLFRQQARNERKFGFTILHAVGASGHRAMDVPAIVITRKARTLQHLGHDLRHRQFLKKPKAAALGETEELRRQGELVNKLLADKRRLRGTCDHAVNDAGKLRVHQGQ